LYEEYQRYHKELVGDSDPFIGPRTIGVDDVLRAHYLLCDFFLREGEEIALAGPRDVNLLMSAIGRQTSGYGGVAKWNDDYEVCATLFYGLIKNHPFHDGNKRTALLIALYHLYKLGRTPTLKHRVLETLAVRTAGNRLSKYPRYKNFTKERDPEVRFLAMRLRKGTRRSDSRSYTVTFHQLNGILQEFGFELGNPSGNYIDVIRVVERKRFLRKPIFERQKILKVGFPGWTKQVTKSALGSVRRETGLTTDKGYDSQVFYKGAEPLESLIAQYHAPLRRLKDR